MGLLVVVLQTPGVMAAPLVPFLTSQPSASNAPAAPPRARDAGGPPSPQPVRRALSAAWTFRRVTGPGVAPEPWLPATVPGCVHTDLFANKRIADPFFRLNEKDQQWVEREGWEYRTTVNADPELLARERIELVFAGLDTYADVLVNGASVLSANNMFRTWRVEIKKQLKPGENVLLVSFRSPIARVKPAYDRLGYKLPAVNDQAAEMLSMFTRKAPYHYGWDWGPRFVTSGVWRSVHLEAWDTARLDDVQIFQDHLDGAVARLTVKARVQATHPGRVTVEVRLAGADGPLLASVEREVKPGANDVAAAVHLDKPQRWWPNGLGPQHLYTFHTTVVTAHGVRDARATRIGLRTIEVLHQRDAEGKSFTIKVNGAPVFMKGANWIPADSFVTRITDDRYRWLLRSAADAHMNMLRVWGGGIYEDDRFYELCDELGLLVWQDFMFACSMYPGDDPFVENVRREAVDNVRRLRNHPSLALWAGNNEIEAAWHNWGWASKFHLSRAVQDHLWSDYQKIFHQLLPAVVSAEDPGRFYTRSSPSANDDGIPANKLGMGDMHYWGVGHAGEPYTKYAANTSRFMSEYGFQSFPDLSTVARYTTPQDRDVESPVMLSHQRHPGGNQLIRTYLLRDFRNPKDFSSFLYVSQVLQATAIQYAAEAHRRQMGHNWGSLYWQLDDCWPVASWSGIDYFGRWKALHYAARRFFAPVLVSAVEEEGTVKVWVISDRRTETATKLTVRLIDLYGKELWRREQAVRLLPNASHAYFTLGKREALAHADPAKVVLVSELTDVETDRQVSRSVLSFVRTKDLDLPAPELQWTVEAQPDGTFAIKVSARHFARSVYLSTGGASAVDGFFDDNYFDLLPGETATVGFRPHTAGLSADQLRPTLRAISIVDSF
ncbi:MAG: glycoside hydrolase family 2 protein [Polyangia bacterium]